jgi:hypothetical protein
LWLRHNSAKKIVVVLAYFDRFGGLTGSVVEYVICYTKSILKT